MKKRLSLLLALMMIVSLLPMSAFAAGVPKVVVQNVTTDDDNKNVVVAFEFTKSSTVDKLSAQVLRLELTNGAKFKSNAGVYEDITVAWEKVSGAGAVVGDVDVDAATGGNQATLKPVGDALAFANVAAGLGINTADVAALKFTFKVDFSDATAGDVNFVVTDSSAVNTGNNEDSVGNQSVKVAVVKEVSASDLAVTVKNAEKTISFDGGQLSQFEVKNFKNMETDDYLTVIPDDDDLKFTSATKVFVDGSELAHHATTADATHFTLKDGGLLFHKDAVNKNKKSVIVNPEFTVGRKATEGDVRVTVAAKYMDGATERTRMSERAVIGKVVDYNVTMTVVEKNKKEMPSVWGGEKVTVTVTLKGPKGSILDRSIDFKADGVKITHKTGTATVKPAPGAGTLDFDGTNKDGFFKDAEFSLVPSETGVLADKEEVKFEIELVTDGDKDGVATLTAAQRGWEVKADAAKITPKFVAKTEISPVKKGEAKEVANIVITEAKADLLAKGDKLTLEFDTPRNYIQFDSKDVKVEATNGMKFGKPQWNAKPLVIEIPVEKTSYKEPAMITISGIKVSVDGSSTDDIVKVKVGISKNTVSSPEYIKVVKEYALESITTVFTIGQTQYTKNGQAMTAASAPYIKNGKTMLPIRAVAEALGLTVQWNGATKTATFSDATKVAAVTIGAEKMYVNGTPVPLAAKAELVNGTTFVELRSLSTAFGVQIDWDAAAKTATVSK